ncbi:MAG: LamG-like jellyroll fold domain-containing protein [Pseudomonadota bacterium]
MQHAYRNASVAATMMMVSLGAVAQGYTPDIAELDERTGLSFAGHPAFNLGEGGTLEFWVAPGWTDDPGYDPVVLSSETDDNFSFVIAMLGDRTGLTVQTADGYGEVAFNFDDGVMHHVAIVNLQGSMVVVVDGQPLDEMTFGLPDEVPRMLWVGSINGEGLPFVGAVGGFRIWDVAVELEELVVFALLDPLDPELPHPDLSALSAYSNLTNNMFEISDLLWDDDTEDSTTDPLVEAGE